MTKEPVSSDPRDLRSVVDGIERRLATIEQHLGLGRAKPPVVHRFGEKTPAASLQLTASATSADVFELPVDAEIVYTESAEDASIPDYREGTAQAATVPAKPLAGDNLENLIGGKIFTWTGGVLLVLAAGWFVVWSWRNLNIPPEGRVAIINLLGIASLAAGWWLGRRDLPVHSRALLGTGVFILYAAALAMTHLYRLGGDLSLVYGFVNGAVVTALAMTIAVRLNSVGIILLGALGGYLTPWLTWRPHETSLDDPVVLVYLALLNLALIGSARVRRWEFIGPLTWAATAVTLLVWLGVSPFVDTHPGSAKLLLALHATLFIALVSVLPLATRTSSTPLDNAILVLTTMGFFAGYGIICRWDPEELTWLSAALAALCSVLSWLGFRRLSARDRLARVALALACIFGTVAISLALREQREIWSTVWAIEGMVFALVGYWFRDRQLAVTSALAFTLAFLRLLVTSAEFTGEQMLPWFDPLVVRWGLMAALLAVAGAGYPWLDNGSRNRQLADSADNQTSEREFRLFAAGLSGCAQLVLLLTVFLQLAPRWDWLLAAWTLQCAGLLAAGVVRASRPLQAFAVFLLILAPGLMATVLIGYNGQDLLLRHDLVSRIVLAFTATVWLVAGWMVWKRPPGLAPEFEQIAHVILSLIGHSLMLYLLTVEVHIAFDALKAAWTTEMAAWSVAWGAYAALAIATGIQQRYRVYRVAGMVLFIVVLLKVFLVDLAQYELIVRVIALFTLGMLLLAVSYLYQRNKSRIGL